MNDRMFRNALAVGIILLFIGVAVQPGIATVQPEQRIPAIIRNKDTLNRLIESLSDLPCDCENDNTNSWFPGNILLCLLIYPLIIPALFFWALTDNPYLLWLWAELGAIYNCGW